MTYKITFSSVNHLQSNGSLKRFDATLQEILRANKMENPNKNLLTILPYDVICYKTTRKRQRTYLQKEKSKILFDKNSLKPPIHIKSET